MIYDEHKKGLENAMKTLGFDVRKHEDCNTNEVFQIIEQIAMDEEMKNCNAFGMAFMSHGGINGQLCTWDGIIKVETIIEKVTSSTKDFPGMPKLFFFEGKLFLKICQFDNSQ